MLKPCIPIERQNYTSLVNMKEENRIEVVLDWTILDCTTNCK